MWLKCELKKYLIRHVLKYFYFYFIIGTSEATPGQSLVVFYFSCRPSPLALVNKTRTTRRTCKCQGRGCVTHVQRVFAPPKGGAVWLWVVRFRVPGIARSRGGRFRKGRDLKKGAFDVSRSPSCPGATMADKYPWCKVVTLILFICAVAIVANEKNCQKNIFQSVL
jgi:hypothetical protein